MTDAQNYQPISCALHDSYELAIMHRQKLKITWQDENQCITEDIFLPIDLKTQNGAEYLITRKMDNTIMEIRLDQIKSSQNTD